MAQIHALTPEGRLPSAAVAHAAEIADDALGTIPERTEPIQKRADDGFAITDHDGRQAFAVTSDGSVVVGDTEHRTDQPGYRVVDQNGQVAFEVTADGRTHIYDPATGGGGVDGELHAFLCVGQSNMSGRARPIIPGWDVPDQRVLQYGGNRRTIEVATVPLDMHDTPSGLSLAHFFAREYLRYAPAGTRVLLIGAAHGATGFQANPGGSWTPSVAQDAGIADLYNLSVTQAREALNLSDAQLKGILWHQGEADLSLSTEVYAGMLDGLISNYRSEFGADVPFVVGQQTFEGMDAKPNRYRMDRAHAELPARLTRTAFVPARRDLANFEDTAHFSRLGAEFLGRGYVDGYRRALTNVTGAIGRTLRPQNVNAVPEGSGVRVTWDAPTGRVVGYRVETSPDGTTWAEQERDWPMYLHHIFTDPSPGLQVRVTALHPTETAEPSTPITIGA